MDSFAPYFWCAGKVLTRDAARACAAALRAAGKTLVTANGAFDLLHAGHVFILTEARAQGDALFVGVNSDHSVKLSKGSTRPIVPELERIALLAALACVDYIVAFDEREIARETLLTVRPHLHVNGAEYGPPEEWVEWPTMREIGARGHRVERVTGVATTDIIGKIRSIP